MDASHEIRYIPPKARDDSSRIPIARRSSSASVEPGGSAIWLQFAIEDSGRGLSEDELNLLFNRFRQASAKTFSSYGGSGLGLFISRELTELQGGQIGVSSRRGSGSCFVFFVRALQVQEGTHDLSRTSSRSLSDDLIASPVLPQTQTFESRPTAQRLASAISPAKTNGTAINEELQTASKPTKLHVLLVEDNIINQKVIATQLRRLGNTVHVANHGLEALHHLQHTTSAAGRPRDPSLPPNPDKPASAEESDDAPFPIDVVLLDQEMPVMDGIETIKRIREMERNGHLGGHVPVIAVTANARGEQVTNAIECGCDRVVTKPFRIPDLVQQMQELLHELSTKQDV
jgi:CheY-like chemotaxis protein